jgi:hypothetical protein
MTLTQRVILSLICAFALVSSPYVLAQETQDQPAQQEQMETQDESLQQDTEQQDVEQETDITVEEDEQGDTVIEEETVTEEDAEEDLPETAGGLSVLALMGLASLAAARFAKR